MISYAYPVTDPKPDPGIPPLVSLAEAAQILGCSRQFAHRMVTKNQLRGRHVGGAWVFRRALVERLAARRTAEKAAAE
jgi:excisionase family DNA binding protein